MQVSAILACVSVYTVTVSVEFPSSIFKVGAVLVSSKVQSIGIRRHNSCVVGRLVLVVNQNHPLYLC